MHPPLPVSTTMITYVPTISSVNQIYYSLHNDTIGCWKGRGNDSMIESNQHLRPNKQEIQRFKVGHATFANATKVACIPGYKKPRDRYIFVDFGEGSSRWFCFLAWFASCSCCWRATNEARHIVGSSRVIRRRVFLMGRPASPASKLRCIMRLLVRGVIISPPSKMGNSGACRGKGNDEVE